MSLAHPRFPRAHARTAASRAVLPPVAHATPIGADARADADSDAIGDSAPPHEKVATLARALRVGDLVFTRIGSYPFRKVADATRTWTNHVGIVLDIAGPQPVIGESRFPFSGTTTFAHFVARSAGGRTAVMRLPQALADAQRDRLVAAAARRAGVFYDTGFDLRSRRQFCSRYVHEVLREGAGIDVGRVETFADLLREAPEADVGFWRLWYFGNIPWRRETITPASLLRSPGLRTVFDGTAD